MVLMPEYGWLVITGLLWQVRYIFSNLKVSDVQLSEERHSINSEGANCHFVYLLEEVVLIL